MFNDDTEIRFHYTTFPLPRFLFFHSCRRRASVYMKKIGEKMGSFLVLYKKIHIAAGSKSAAVHLIFFFVLTGTVHTPIPFFHLPRTNTKTLSPSTVDFHSM